jgi:hypothetical protein
MLTGPEWAGLGVAATLFGGFIAHRIGWIQIGINRQTLALNVKKSTPRIGSRVELKSAQLVNRPDITRYTIHTTIYNDGDLVAREIKGEWKLTASHGIAEASVPVRADSLPSFLSFPLEHEIGGKYSSLWCEPTVIIQVDVDLIYLGLDDKKETYHATYDYDYKNRKIVQR